MGTPHVFAPILCAVDRSPHAATVAYTAAGMAMQFANELVLLRSDPRVNASDPERISALRDMQQLAETSVLGPSGGTIKVRTDVVVDAPADGIRRYIAATSPQMVLMGSRGHSRLGRSLFGSTALSLMQTLTVPLVVVPPTDPEIFTVLPQGVQCHVGAVLVPVDFSDAMDGQLQFANAMLATHACPVTLLHVAKKDESSRHGELDAIKARMGGGGDVTTQVVEGDLRQVLRGLLRGDTFGLVIMGLDRHRTGAVASDLLHVSTALVAVVP